jgi:tetratricopeptide (TPR) repeat protein
MTKRGELFHQALAIKERTLGKEHPKTAVSYSNIAGVLDIRRQYDEALEWYQKALEIRERVFGREHPDTACSIVSREYMITTGNMNEH